MFITRWIIKPLSMRGRLDKSAAVEQERVR